MQAMNRAAATVAVILDGTEAMVDCHAGVRLGAAKPLRHPQLPGHVQFHGTLSAVGPARILGRAS